MQVQISFMKSIMAKQALIDECIHSHENWLRENLINKHISKSIMKHGKLEEDE